MQILQWLIILELIQLPLVQALGNSNIDSIGALTNLLSSFRDFVNNIPISQITSLFNQINKAVPELDDLNLDSIGTFLDKLADIVQEIGNVLQKALNKTKN